MAQRPQTIKGSRVALGLEKPLRSSHPCDCKREGRRTLRVGCQQAFAIGWSFFPSSSYGRGEG